MAAEVDYEPVRVLEHELEEKIRDAIINGQHYYIGAAKAEAGETPIQAMCHREGTRCAPDAERCSQAGRHHADKRARNLGLTLVKVFYAEGIIMKDKVCKLEKELIAECKAHPLRPLCLNVRSGETDCIKRDRGIVYVRIYE